jgi:HEAT repeat protein
VLKVVAVLVLLFAQEDRIRELIEQLRSDSGVKRNEATLELKKLGKAAIPQLEAAARDSDLEVSSRARQALAAIALRARLTPALLAAVPGIDDRLAAGGDRAAAQELLAAAADLGRGSSSLRAADLQCIAPAAVRGARSTEDLFPVLNLIQRHRLSAAVFELLDLLENPDQRTRVGGIITLAGIAGETPDWTVNVDDITEEQVVRVATGMLVDVDRTGVETRLLRSLDSPKGWRRRISIRGLAILGCRAALPDILKFERSEEPGTRADVILALGELGVREESNRVLEALNDPSSQVRAAAILSSGKLRDERAIARLLPQLPGSTDELQIAACRALAEMPSREALPALIRIYAEGIPPARRAAETALRRHDPKDVAAAMTRAMAGQPLNVRIRAVGLLAEIDASGATLALEAFLSTDDSAELRIEVLKALSKFHSVSSSAKILPLLDHPNPRLRGTAARTLAELGDDGVVPKLVDLLSDFDWNARYNAVVGLSALDAKTHAAKLVPLAFASKNPEWVRTAALKALEKLGGPEEARALSPLLDEGNFEIRTAAAKVLASMGVPESVRVVLSETHDWIGLNGLKQPQDWTRVRSELVAEDLKGSLQQVVERLAATLGRTVAWPEDWGNREVDLRAPRTLVAKDRRKSLLEAFREVLPAGITLVLDKDQVRILTHEQELEFWPKWRDNEKK